jgi:hypothetical protein
MSIKYIQSSELIDILYYLAIWQFLTLCGIAIYDLLKYLIKKWKITL